MVEETLEKIYRNQARQRGMDGGSIAFYWEEYIKIEQWRMAEKTFEKYMWKWIHSERNEWG